MTPTNSPSPSWTLPPAKYRKPTPEEQGKDPCAVSLGHRGDLKGGKAQAASMTPTRRAQIAKAAAKARWNKR